MKYLLAVLFLIITGLAFAGGPQQHHNNRHYNNNHRHHPHHRLHWVAPVFIGSAIGYGLTRNYYEPYYYSLPPATVCTRYVYQDQYGNVTREETRCE